MSDYGIGSSSSKANSVKDVDTDDSCSILVTKRTISKHHLYFILENIFQDDKDNNVYESSNKDTSSASNQSQSEDETQVNKNISFNSKTNELYNKNNYSTNLYTTNLNNVNNSYNNSPLDTKNSKFSSETKEEPEPTYEGAIQNYRARIKSKINIDESIFNKPQNFNKSKEANEAQSLLPKGNLFKKKELFEGDKTVEIGHLESPTSRRLSEEFANSQSIKDRLKSLAQYTDQPLKHSDKCDVPLKSVKERLQNFSRQNDSDGQNNNLKPLKQSTSQSNINKISDYLLDKSNNHFNLEPKNLPNDWRIKDGVSDRSSSPEAELYMNKLNMFNRDLDTIMNGKPGRNVDNDLDYIRNPNYMPSSSANDLIGLSSDREDSGIHTADVSCSVSQADEQLDENELTSSTIPKCIEKLKINGTEEAEKSEKITKPIEVINLTLDFIHAEKKHSDANCVPKPEQKKLDVFKESGEKPFFEDDIVRELTIYENIEVKPFPTEFISSDLFANPALSLAPPKHMLPPKEKPPPPPPGAENEKPEVNLKRLNSAKRLKKENQIKRSSFLGLDEPLNDQLDPDMIIDRPPDIKSFLQKESSLEKSLYKKLQGSREGGLSEVESQDSGLEVERGRLSSDTWCSSLIDSSTPVHNRQDSGVSAIWLLLFWFVAELFYYLQQTNSFTSEEEEIMKKEREIIEMVEKEEKSRDGDYLNQSSTIYQNNRFLPDEHYDSKLVSDKFATPFVPQVN